MRIAINEIVLAEISGPVGVREFRVKVARAVESAQFLRGTAGAFIDRMNSTTCVTFAVTRLHASVRDAEVFLLAHESEMPTAGLASFTARGENGQEVTRYLSNALVEATDAGYEGLSTRHLYTIRGGRMLATRPT